VAAASPRDLSARLARRLGADWLDGHVPPGGLIVDLGAGTGSLSAAILDALPYVHVQLVDVDPDTGEMG
jgi:methylase of polypeptide subunit release factors